MKSKADADLDRIQACLDALSPEERVKLFPLSKFGKLARLLNQANTRSAFRQINEAFIGGKEGDDQGGALPCAADAYFGRGPSLAERVAEQSKRIEEETAQAWKYAPIRRAHEQLQYEQELERLRGRPNGSSSLRSRSVTGIELRATVAQMHREGFSQEKMCSRLDANERAIPEHAAWGGLSWRKAYRSPEYGRRVKTWLSKASRNGRVTK